MHTLSKLSLAGLALASGSCGSTAIDYRMGDFRVNDLREQGVAVVAVHNAREDALESHELKALAAQLEGALVKSGLAAGNGRVAVLRNPSPADLSKAASKSGAEFGLVATPISNATRRSQGQTTDTETRTECYTDSEGNVQTYTYCETVGYNSHSSSTREIRTRLRLVDLQDGEDLWVWEGNGIERNTATNHSPAWYPPYPPFPRFPAAEEVLAKISEKSVKKLARRRLGRGKGRAKLAAQTL